MNSIRLYDDNKGIPEFNIVNILYKAFCRYILLYAVYSNYCWLFFVVSDHFVIFFYFFVLVERWVIKESNGKRRVTAKKKMTVT